MGGVLEFEVVVVAVSLDLVALVKRSVVYDVEVDLHDALMMMRMERVDVLESVADSLILVVMLGVVWDSVSQHQKFHQAKARAEKTSIFPGTSSAWACW